MKAFFDANGALIVEGEDATEWFALRIWSESWNDNTAPLWIKVKENDPHAKPRGTLMDSWRQLFRGPNVMLTGPSERSSRGSGGANS
jgi:hypothetical protein